MKYIALLLSMLIAMPVYGHSGRTNSDGCHNVRNDRGESIGYHCHNGSGGGDRSDIDWECLILAGVIVWAVVEIVDKEDDPKECFAWEFQDHTVKFQPFKATKIDLGGHRPPSWQYAMELRFEF